MPRKREIKAVVHQSGNSDVDVNVTVDTTALAYAFATFLFVDGRLKKDKYDEMIKELDKHTGRKEEAGTGDVAHLISKTKRRFLT
ncbi:hypothetical protein [Evansella tamaricis]|uniref:Uncharacterized protein n=1 Tax=Evansella tamaricis TaxID=2069301 RepID=A0ABS6JFD0_9BACI|nr:hypothetical protein [Evansella tamaricis]MBU9712095.1 hypothetical protein [Evansella tamaricis]